MAGADRDEIAFGRLQEALDFRRHGGITVVELALVLDLRIVAVGDHLLHRVGVARLPGSRQQIEDIWPLLQADQFVQQQTILKLLGPRAEQFELRFGVFRSTDLLVRLLRFFEEMSVQPLCRVEPHALYFPFSDEFGDPPRPHMCDGLL
jgi:hypothetical protein